MYEVTICLVNYNTPELTLKCIDSILEYTSGIRYQIVLVDNGSSKKNNRVIKDRLNGFGENLIFVENQYNHYFTGGFNQATTYAEGKYILILNSDTYFVDNSIKAIYDFMESDETIGASEGIIRRPDGMITMTSSRELTRVRELSRKNIFFKLLLLPVFIRYKYKGWKREETKEVDVVCDAFMMVERKLFSKIGGYNEALLYRRIPVRQNTERR